MKKQSTAPTRALTARTIVMAAFGAYFAVLFVGGFLHHSVPVISPDFVKYLHPVTYGLAWLITTGVLIAYGTISAPVVAGFSWIATVLYAVETALSGGSSGLSIALCGVVAVMTYAAGTMIPFKPWKPLSGTAGKALVIIVAAVTGGGILFLLLSSYLNYTTDPTVSTSVYIQMMASLRGGFSMDTSLEFGEVVSHLSAHVSPIFLLYLPFYALIPSPVTLMVLQTLAVSSAVIPLWLICRRRGVSTGYAAALCALLSLFPAVFLSSAAGLHEYALLLPLLLWLFWALDAHRPVLTWVFAGLTLCVRETAAIFVLTVGLYHLIANRRPKDAVSVGKNSDCSHHINPDAGAALRRERVKGIILMGVSAAYLITCLILLTVCGKGTLITRFENITGIYGTNFETLLHELFLNPALSLFEMFTESKMKFVLLLILPLGLLPLFTRKKINLVFLIPLCLLNLLSDFPYHYNINYPYAYGMTAFLLIVSADALSALSLKADKARFMRGAVACALAFTAVIGVFQVSSFRYHVEYLADSRSEVTIIGELLKEVPDEATVTASARLTPQLAARTEAYSFRHEARTDYVVIDLREEWALDAEKTYTVDHFKKLGYEMVNTREGIIAVMKKAA